MSVIGQPPEITGLSYANRLQIAAESRFRAISARFNCEPVSLSSLMGPMGDGPEWPSGASWLALTHNGNPCIISDGLSDPWVERDRSENGLGLEVYVEAADLRVPDPDNLESIADTWLFPMAAEISHTLATYPNLCKKLLNDEILALPLNIEHIKDGRGLVTMLLHKPNTPNTVISIQNTEFQLIVATLLTPEDVSFLRGKGDEGRVELLMQFNNSGQSGKSYLNR